MVRCGVLKRRLSQRPQDIFFIEFGLFSDGCSPLTARLLVNGYEPAIREEAIGTSINWV